MKLIYFLLLYCGLPCISYSQDSTVTFRSNLFRTFYKEKGEDTMKQTEASFTSHLILFDRIKKRILVYDKKKQFELNILDNKPKEQSKNIESFHFACIDIATLTECTVSLRFFEDKPFSFEIDFGNLKIQYFLEE